MLDLIYEIGLKRGLEKLGVHDIREKALRALIKNFGMSRSKAKGTYGKITKPLRNPEGIPNPTLRERDALETALGYEVQNLLGSGDKEVLKTLQNTTKRMAKNQRKPRK